MIIFILENLYLYIYILILPFFPNLLPSLEFFFPSLFIKLCFCLILLLSFFSSSFPSLHLPVSLVPLSFEKQCDIYMYEHVQKGTRKVSAEDYGICQAFKRWGDTYGGSRSCLVWAHEGSEWLCTDAPTARERGIGKGPEKERMPRRQWPEHAWKVRYGQKGGSSILPHGWWLIENDWQVLTLIRL